MNFRSRNIDLVGKQNLWFGLSLAVILVGLFSWMAFGLNLGIDFKGGGQLQYRIPLAQRPAAGQEVQLISTVREALEKKGIARPKLQVAGGNALIVQTNARDDAELKGQERIISSTLAGQWKIDAATDKTSLQPLSRQLVGPVIGRELRINAIKGVLFGVALIALWIYIRYNFAGDGLRYAVAGIVALLHDVLVLVGLFALIGRIDPRVEIDGSFIAALLTVVGYSINDSVVIFDRLRENLRNRRKESFNTIINDSLLETMSRSINTGLTVIIMLLVLLLLGGESIYNFVLAMLVGIVSGLYSSIFNASMVLVAWNNWEQKKARANRGAGARTAVRSGAATRSGAFANSSTATRAEMPSGLAASSGAASVNRGAVNPANPTLNGAAHNPATPTTGVFVESDIPAPAPEIDQPSLPAASGADAETAPRPPRKARARRRF